MTDKKKASTMVQAIVDYIYEEGEGQISNAEVLGVVEFVKLTLLEDMMEAE